MVEATVAKLLSNAGGASSPPNAAPPDTAPPDITPPNEGAASLPKPAPNVGGASFGGGICILTLVVIC